MKKIISLVLAVILVFAMGVSAFAYNNIGSIPEHDHEWEIWEIYDWGAIYICTICDIEETKYFSNVTIPGTEEENPDTGAPAILGVIALASAACLAFKRK
ncbi:MAG: hypothetical protein IKU42_07450 [Oscillospiraceae bacterium]|nr:hypothetical protein [Oscillospiraceae bacterium]